MLRRICPARPVGSCPISFETNRRRIGSRWRVLPPGRQALPVLVHLRRNETFTALAEAFGIGAATAHRYVTEVVDLLAELAPDLRQAMRTAQRKA